MTYYDCKQKIPLFEGEKEREKNYEEKYNEKNDGHYYDYRNGTDNRNTGIRSSSAGIHNHLRSSRRASDQIIGSWAGNYGRMVVFKDGRYVAMFGSSMHEETGMWEFDGRNCLMLYRENENVLLYYSNKTLRGTVNGRRIVFYDDTKAMLPAYNHKAKAKDFNGFWRVKTVSSGSAIAAPSKEMYAYVYGRRVCMSWNDWNGSNEESRSTTFKLTAPHR